MFTVLILPSVVPVAARLAMRARLTIPRAMRRTVGAALAAMLFTLDAAPARAQGETGNVCLGNFVQPASCTANDVGIGTLVVRSVIKSCDEGVPFEAEVVFEAVLASNSPDRYGIGAFVALDGGSAISADRCLHSFLSPRHPSTDPSAWPANVQGRYVSPFPNLNGDACGDLPGKSSVALLLMPVKVACRDTDGDGFVDVNACASWESNANAACTSLRDAVPGSPSKCGCRTVSTNLPMPAKLTIVKRSLGGDGTFAFSANPPGRGFNITTTDGRGEAGPVAVAPGTYSITEFLQRGWTIEGASCSNGDEPSALRLAAGDDVVCTFTNRLTARTLSSVTIVKQAVGGDGTFAFDADGRPISIATNGGTGQRTFEGVEPGLHVATEKVPAGWTLQSIQCSDGSPTDVTSATARIDLAAGEEVTCTFVNARGAPPPPPPPPPPPERGTITIIKTSLDGNGTFPFLSGEHNVSITTVDGTGRVSFDVPAGKYDVTEMVPAGGWRLESIACSDDSPTDVASATAHIDVAGGETVTCTFVDRLVRGNPASITIVKNTVGGNGTFTFTGSGRTISMTTANGTGHTTIENVAPGTYEVVESAVPDWRLESIDCTGESSTDVVTRTARINLAAGGMVMCTYVNVRVEPVPALPWFAVPVLMALMILVAARALQRREA
jgi:hypothetical protein